MKVFLSKKDNETRMELISQTEEKCEIKFLDGPKKGQRVSYSKATIKRWWKEIEVTKKVTEKPSTKKRCKAKKVDRSKEFSELDAFIGNTYENKWYSSVKCYKIMKGKKPIAEVYPQKKKILCYFHSLKGKDLTKTLFYKEGYNYYLPVRVDISYDSDFISILGEFLKED